MSERRRRTEFYKKDDKDDEDVLKKLKEVRQNLQESLDDDQPTGPKPVRKRGDRKLYKKEDRQRHVFLSERKTPIDATTVYRMVRSMGKYAGLEFPIHPHMLRHGCGYYLANKGVDTRAIQMYMGHTNIQNTVIYTQLSGKSFNGFWGD